MFQFEGRLGEHLSVFAHPRPGRLGLDLSLQSLNHFVVMQFGKKLVTHFNEQGNVAVCAKASIHAKTNLDGLRVGYQRSPAQSGAAGFARFSPGHHVPEVSAVSFRDVSGQL